MYFDYDDFDIRDRYHLIEEKKDKLQHKIESLSPSAQHSFSQLCTKAYIFHDSALEGLVVNADEIASVFSSENEAFYIRSRVLQEIKNHKKVLQNVITQAEKQRHKNQIYRSKEISIENVLSMHESLYEGLTRKAPGKMRQQMPLHLSYFHKIIEPQYVENQLLKLCRNTKDPEFRTQHPINQAALFHYKFMTIFPFIHGCGKVGRLLMNSFLLQGGYELAIIHGSERQHYYEALRQGLKAFRLMLLDSIESALDSKDKFLKEVDLNQHTNKVVYRSSFAPSYPN